MQGSLLLEFLCALALIFMQFAILLFRKLGLPPCISFYYILSLIAILVGLIYYQSLRSQQLFEILSVGDKLLLDLGFYNTYYLILATFFLLMRDIIFLEGFTLVVRGNATPKVIWLVYSELKWLRQPFSKIMKLPFISQSLLWFLAHSCFGGEIGSSSSTLLLFLRQMRCDYVKWLATGKRGL